MKTIEITRLAPVIIIAAALMIFTGILVGVGMADLFEHRSSADLGDILGLMGALLGVIGAFFSAVYLAKRTDDSAHNKHVDLVEEIVEHAAQHIAQMLKNLDKSTKPDDEIRADLIREIEKFVQIVQAAKAGQAGAAPKLLIAMVDIDFAIQLVLFELRLFSNRNDVPPDKDLRDPANRKAIYANLLEESRTLKVKMDQLRR